MSYRLRKKSLAHEVHRVAREELEGALRGIFDAVGRRPGSAVHEARKHLKKVRALIRLLRPALDEGDYKRINTMLRDAGREMSPIRDAQVRVQTANELIEHSAKRRIPRAFGRVRAAMTSNLRRVLSESAENGWNNDAAARIERALSQISECSMKRLTMDAIRTGLKKAWKRARRALAEAQRDATDESLHELRKAIKDLWYCLRLLRSGKSAAIKTLIKRTGALGEDLGKDHDFAMLVAARHERGLASEEDWQVLGKEVARRRRRLQRSGLRLAERILAPTPRVFADFVVRRWKAWRTERK